MMTRKQKLALLSLVVVSMPFSAAHAQDARAFMDRANAVYTEHVQCGIDLAVAIPAHQNAPADKAGRFQEAFTQYMNRLLGVAAATGREQTEVLTAIRAGVSDYSARLSATGLSDSQRKEMNDASTARTKACLVSIGYQTS
jgi:hypothetical protein